MHCTVVIPTYRRAELLADCLRSLLTVGEGVEVIVVVDGPDDATARLERSFDPGGAFTLRWIVLEENGGLANARNVGARNATGESSCSSTTIPPYATDGSRRMSRTTNGTLSPSSCAASSSRPTPPPLGLGDRTISAKTP